MRTIYIGPQFAKHTQLINEWVAGYTAPDNPYSGKIVVVIKQPSVERKPLVEHTPVCLDVQFTEIQLNLSVVAIGSQLMITILDRNRKVVALTQPFERHEIES